MGGRKNKSVVGAAGRRGKPMSHNAAAVLRLKTADILVGSAGFIAEAPVWRCREPEAV